MRVSCDPHEWPFFHVVELTQQTWILRTLFRLLPTSARILKWTLSAHRLIVLVPGHTKPALFSKRVVAVPPWSGAHDGGSTLPSEFKKQTNLRVVVLQRLAWGFSALKVSWSTVTPLKKPDEYRKDLLRCKIESRSVFPNSSSSRRRERRDLRREELNEASLESIELSSSNGVDFCNRSTM